MTLNDLSGRRRSRIIDTSILCATETLHGIAHCVNCYGYLHHQEWVVSNTLSIL